MKKRYMKIFDKKNEKVWQKFWAATIKHLVLDGKYSYLETGSLISIKKNVNEKTYSCKQKACGSI